MRWFARSYGVEKLSLKSVSGRRKEGLDRKVHFLFCILRLHTFVFFNLHLLQRVVVFCELLCFSTSNATLLVRKIHLFVCRSIINKSNINDQFRVCWFTSTSIPVFVHQCSDVSITVVVVVVFVVIISATFI